MPQLLNLSRAARLVGVTRVALQKKIKDVQGNENTILKGKCSAAS